VGARVRCGGDAPFILPVSASRWCPALEASFAYPHPRSPFPTAAIQATIGHPLTRPAGSVVWVINGFFVWLPLQLPSATFPGESSLGGGITAFVGATIFEFGSVLLMLEAVNENRSECFGWALEEALTSTVEEAGQALESTAHSRALALLRPRHEECRHSHRSKTTFLKPAAWTVSDDDDENTGGEDGSPPAARARKWSWMPSRHELRTHYMRDIGFLACLAQMVGATIFWIAGFTGLPPILDTLSVPAENGVFWLPQVVGGTGFIVSSFLFMLETQSKWYLPAPELLGWHIGFWNLVGAIGFTLCGALGFGIDQDGVEYALTLATFVGSWAFLVSRPLFSFASFGP